MPLDNPKGGIGYAAEFQSAALPWVTSSFAPATGSPTRLDFPKVTRFITVSTFGSAGQVMSIGFTRNGVLGNNKMLLSGTTTLTLELRINQLFLQGESGTPQYSVCAGLTTINAGDMPMLSGTLNDGTPGWPGVG